MLEKSRVYTRLLETTAQQLLELKAAPEVELLKLHSLSVIDGKQTCVTKRLNPALYNGRYVPRIKRRKCKTAKRKKDWTVVGRETLSSGGHLKEKTFSTAREADWAALMYRFWADVDFRLAVIRELNPGFNEASLMKSLKLENIEKEYGDQLE